MRKLISIALAALSLLAGSVRAESDMRHFKYYGFYDESRGVFSPYLHEEGWFMGEDKNKDGTIDQSELTTLMTRWGDLKQCNSSGLTCSINSFSFKRTGELSFDISLSRRYDNMDLVAIWRSGELLLDRNVTAGFDYRHYSVAPGTHVNISGVPEPLSASMLSLGLGFIAFAARTRRPATHRDA